MVVGAVQSFNNRGKTETLATLLVVPTIEQRRRLFEQIVALRRAERQAPDSRDIVTVRGQLEDELGGILTRHMAAELLGVSHTALARWIKSGDLPLVISAEGRKGVPVGALADLHEALSRERSDSARRLHHLEPLIAEQRDRAARLDPHALVDAGSSEDPHDRARRRALAYHRAVAKSLKRSTVDDALHRLWRWRDSGRIDDRYADAWEGILNLPLRDIKRAIAEDTPRADDLRQNSPFAGTLSEAERRRILDEVT